MGKNVGLIGSVSGKVGNVVYSVQGGVQTVRSYQPIVSNPKSAGQQRQRAKGNAAGRISSFVPGEALMGLGQNARMRRGEFLRILLKSAVVAQVADGYSAKVNVGDIIFSKGSVLPSVTMGSITPAAGSVSVSLSGVGTSIMPAEEYEQHATRLVALVYQGADNRLVACSTVLAVTPDQGAAATTVMPLGVQGNYTVYVYAIPMKSASRGRLTVTTEMVFLTDNELTALLGVGDGSLFLYGLSGILGNAVFQQA